MFQLEVLRPVQMAPKIWSEMVVVAKSLPEAIQPE
jgi:hypothetical protein